MAVKNVGAIQESPAASPAPVISTDPVGDGSPVPRSVISTGRSERRNPSSPSASLAQDRCSYVKPRTCPICGGRFYTCGAEWGYRIVQEQPKKRRLYFCSWTCLRKFRP